MIIGPRSNQPEPTLQPSAIELVRMAEAPGGSRNGNPPPTKGCNLRSLISLRSFYPTASRRSAIRANLRVLSGSVGSG